VRIFYFSTMFSNPPLNPLSFYFRKNISLLRIKTPKLMKVKENIFGNSWRGIGDNLARGQVEETMAFRPKWIPKNLFIYLSLSYLALSFPACFGTGGGGVGPSPQGVGGTTSGSGAGTSSTNTNIQENPPQGGDGDIHTDATPRLGPHPTPGSGSIPYDPIHIGPYEMFFVESVEECIAPPSNVQEGNSSTVRLHIKGYMMHPSGARSFFAPTANISKDPEYAGQWIRLTDLANGRYSEGGIGAGGDFDIALETKKGSHLVYLLAPVGYPGDPASLPVNSGLCSAVPNDPASTPLSTCAPNNYDSLITNPFDHPKSPYPDESTLSTCSSN
jgi:hypothetical protein